MPTSSKPLLEGARSGAPATAVRAPRHEAVSVQAGGRLHLGFLDPSATLGRRFGSIGMMLEGATTAVRLSRAGVQRVEGSPDARHEIVRARSPVAD